MTVTYLEENTGPVIRRPDAKGNFTSGTQINRNKPLSQKGTELLFNTSGKHYTID
jgi:hypothetical protein